MAQLGKQQILLDSVDLTGQQPVYSQKVIEKTVEIHNLDGEDVKMQTPISGSTSPSFVSIVDRRLRYYTFFRIYQKSFGRAVHKQSIENILSETVWLSKKKKLILCVWKCMET